MDQGDRWTDWGDGLGRQMDGPERWIKEGRKRGEKWKSGYLKKYK